MGKKNVAGKTKVSNEDHGLPSLALVFGYIAVKESQRLEDRVAVLHRLGYGNSEIAAICDTTPATVATLKSKGARSKKARGSKGSKSPKARKRK